MKKKNNSVFFSCVLEGIYTEFKIEEKSLNRVNELLKREVYFNNRYASIFTQEEMSRAKMREKFLKNVLDGQYLNLITLRGDDEIFKQWVTDFLSNIKLEKVFALKVDSIPSYFKAMRMCGKLSENGTICENQMKLYVYGCKNTEVLEESYIILEDDSFSVKDELSIKQSKEVVYQKMRIPYQERKIS